MEKEKMLKELGLKTMFDITKEQMPALVDEYEVFMHHVQVLEKIDTTGVAIMAYPYDVETTYMRDDQPVDVISREEALKNAKDVEQNQVKVPKVVG